MEIITTHINADFDCLGAMTAARLLYPGARIAFPGSQEKGVRDFLARHPDYLPAVVRAKEIDLDAVTRLIIVDCQHAARIGRFAALLSHPGMEIHIFDHHPPTDDSIRANTGEIRTCGSTSTMLTQRLMEHDIRLTPEEATVIMLGIHEDTGRLLFPSTTPEDYRAAAWLLEQGARPALVNEALTPELTRPQMDLLRQLLGTLKNSVINGVVISLAHASSDTYIGDVASLAHLLRDMENLDALFLAVAMENHVYLVARSRSPEVNAGEIMKLFGGGGHATAASATIHNQQLKQVLKRLDEQLRAAVSPRQNVSGIMSSPVKTMADNVTIAEARELLTRYNCNAMPVMNNGRMCGIISRKIVEKAIYHDLGGSPVTDFMHTEFLRATPETLLTEIQEYMVGGNRRFVPVFEGERLCGAVTRTDLLRHIYGGKTGQPEALYDMESLEEPPRSRSVAGLIAKRLPEEVRGLLRQLGDVADELGLRIYAVGGFVRDLLLGINNLDIDVTVEGDGIFFAERFAERHNCRVRSHATFSTAVVVFPDGRKIDVASTRLEYYDSPGVLPTIERASLRHDLYRRDFTVNTLAVCINRDAFGRLSDFFRGQQDIQERVVRVLHNLSFVEDPTRVFRAIRFEQRLGFHLAPHTENLIRSAVRMHLLDKLGGKRLLTELKLIMQEKEPLGAIERMAALGLLPYIHTSLKLVPDTVRVLRESAQVMAWFRLLYLGDTCEQWQVYFLAVTDMLKQEEFQEACHRLEAPGRLLNTLASQRRRVHTLLDTIKRRLRQHTPVLNSEVHEWFSGLSLELLLYLASRASNEQVRRFVSLYLTRLRTITPELDGNDLRAMGLETGPRFGQIMARLLKARLDGKTVNREQDRALARDLITSNNRHTVS